jgi:hypothetical protein
VQFIEGRQREGQKSRVVDERETEVVEVVVVEVRMLSRKSSWLV